MGENKVISKGRWRPMSGLEDLFLISDKGEVYSIKADLIKSLRIRGGSLTFQYMSFSNRKKAKSNQCSVARKVALTFIPNPYDLRYVIHLDGDIANNHVDNLEWSHSVRKGFTSTRIPITLINKSGERFNYSSFYDAAEDIGISPYRIAKVYRGENSTVLGYKVRAREVNNDSHTVS